MCPEPAKISATKLDMKLQRGFTIIELIAVVVILGIIAVSVVPRFFDRGMYDSREFYDQVISTLRYAQKAAISQRRFVCVAFGTNSVTVTYDPTAPSASYTATTCAATNNMTSPLGTSPLTVTSSNATLSGGTTFYFDALGRPFPAQSITVSGYSTSITVAAETGYVY